MQLDDEDNYAPASPGSTVSPQPSSTPNSTPSTPSNAPAMPVLPPHDPADFDSGACWAYLTDLYARVPGTYEVRIVGVEGNPGWTASGYFRDPATLISQVACWVSRWRNPRKQTRPPQGICMTLNPVLPALYARRAGVIQDRLGPGSTTTDTEIPRIRCLLIDIDPERLSNTSSSDEQVEAARVVAVQIATDLTNAGWPPPTVTMSGNGWHLRYPVDLDPTDATVLQIVLQDLAAKYSIPGVVKVDVLNFNPSRIAKLPGTKACKGSDVPGEAPHRLSRLVQLGSPTLVTRDQLMALAVELEGAPSATPTNTPGAGLRPPQQAQTAAKDKSKSKRVWLRTLGADIAVETEETETTLGQFFADNEADDTKIYRCFCPLAPRDSTSQRGEAYLIRRETCLTVHCSRSTHDHSGGRYQPGRSMPEDADPDTYSALDMSNSGAPLPSLRNVVTVLEADPRWKDRIWYDQFHLRPRVTPLGGADRLAEDQDIAELAVWLDATYGLRVRSTSMVGEAMMLVGHRQACDPLTEMLEGLPTWDKVERWKRIPAEVLHLTDSQDIATAGWFLQAWGIGAVARGRCTVSAGVKLDTVPVLQGPQGLQKSGFWRALAGPYWFSDSPLALDKPGDVVLAMRRAWVIEFPELDQVRRRENTQVKAFLAQQVDEGRLPYGRIDTVQPRRSVIVGTTNEATFLTDPSGGRRYWIIRVPDGDTPIDLDLLQSWREQLWAEAVHRHREGERWWLTYQEERSLAAINERYTVEDPWDGPITRWVETTGTFYGSIGFTIAEAGTSVGSTITRASKGDSTRIGQILRSAGCKCKRSKRGTQWWAPGYAPPDAA